MLHYFWRLSALGIRFLCPLVVLALSNAETMGAYYLFVSYFTFVVGVSSLELAVPFSRKYLRCKSDRPRRILFSGFLTNLIAVTTVLVIPAGVLFAGWAGVPIDLTPLFCLALATEAWVNESGRFFFNIGEWKIISLREFIRALIFTAAILVSVYIENEVLTSMTFLTMSVGNMAIMVYEWRSWGGVRTASDIKILYLRKSTWLRVRKSLAKSMPQFLQMQLLGLQPLLERTLIEKTAGLAPLAAFSFLTSVVQSAASLQLVPLVAKTRQLILGARSVSERNEANRQAIFLGLKIAAISGGLALAIYVSMPLLDKILARNLTLTPSLLLVAYASSVSAIFCSALAPMFTIKGFALWSNVLTALAMGCLLLGQYFRHEESVSEVLIFILCGVAAFQVTWRVLFILRDAKKSASR